MWLRTVGGLGLPVFSMSYDSKYPWSGGDKTCHQRMCFLSTLVVIRQAMEGNIGLLPVLLVSERDEPSVLATWRGGRWPGLVCS